VRERIEFDLGCSDPATDMLDDFSRFSHAFNLFFSVSDFFSWRTETLRPNSAP
jgi:hypothetical protein